MIINKKTAYIIVLIFIVIGARYAYKFTPYRIEFLGYYDKIWTHRVNSLEKQEAALLFYKGIEFDLDYIEKRNFLDINHLPATSIHLSFEKYLENINTTTYYPYLWLDIKELNTSNNRKILNKIQPIFESKNYPLEKVLIEGMEVEALQIFKNSGFKTSLYLPWYLNDLNENELLAEIENLKKIESKFPDTAFSTSYSQYKLIRKYFPDKTLYVWIVGHHPIKDYFLCRKILKDDKVQAVLSPYRSYKGGNR